MSGPNSIHNAKLAELQRIDQQFPTKTGSNTENASGASFQGLLEDKLKISGHAQKRLESRGIDLTDNEWKGVLNAVDKAAEKGAKECLVIVNRNGNDQNDKDLVAMVVSVKNRTVITAVDKDHIKENVFTNIDSTVMVLDSENNQPNQNEKQGNGLQQLDYNIRNSLQK